jgi:hypothetical protein
MNVRMSLSVISFVAVLGLSSSLEVNLAKPKVTVPSYVADGTDPLPNPYLKPKGLVEPVVVADGTDPMPNPYPKPKGNLSPVLVADGTDPLPNPYAKSDLGLYS